MGACGRAWGHGSAIDAVRRLDGNGALQADRGSAWSSRCARRFAGETMRTFGSVPLLDARSLAGPVVDVQVTAGTELVHEGMEIGTFFVIRSGSAELTQGEHQVGTLGTGDCFGEIDPLAASPQPFGVTASSPMRLLTFSAFGISRLCEAIPGTRERLIESLPEQGAEVHFLHPAPSGPLPQRRRIEHGDRAVGGRYPPQLAHQSQSA